MAKTLLRIYERVTSEKRGPQIFQCLSQPERPITITNAEWLELGKPQKIEVALRSADA